MKDYIDQAYRTNSRLNVAIGRHNDDLLHGGIGLATESGEILDQLKKHFFYGKPLDVINLKEEIGDCFWYLAILCKYLGCTFEELQHANIEKLRIRYPEKFNEIQSTNRNVQKERENLEKNLH